MHGEIGELVTDGERTRRLAWEGLLNARDLGGYPVGEDRETRWGAVVRSDSLTPLTEAGRAALIAYGVRSIVDLRRPAEIEAQPNPFAEAGGHSIAYTNIPFQDPAVPSDAEPETLALIYIDMLERFRVNVAAMMAAIADAPEGGVLVHCAGGKDRTGLVAALLLDLAGVVRETIAADYALTAEYLGPLDADYLENGPGERADRERTVAKYSPRAEVMLETLDYLDERYGGVEGYLLAAGVTPEDIARLRRRLLPNAAE